MGQTLVSGQGSVLTQCEQVLPTFHDLGAGPSHVVTESQRGVPSLRCPTIGSPIQRHQPASFSERRTPTSCATLLESSALHHIARHSICAVTTLEHGENLQLVLSRIAQLLNEPETDDFGIARPSDFAYETAVNLLNAAAPRMKSTFPRGTAVVDHEGGIQLSWMGTDRQLHLIIRAHPTSRHLLFYYFPSGHRVRGLEAGPSAAEVLASWLDSFCEGRVPD